MTRASRFCVFACVTAGIGLFVAAEVTGAGARPPVPAFGPAGPIPRETLAVPNGPPPGGPACPAAIGLSASGVPGLTLVTTGEPGRAHRGLGHATLAAHLRGCPMLAPSSLLLDVALAAGTAPAAGQPPFPTLRILDEKRSPAAELAQTGLVARALDAPSLEYVPLAIEPPAGHTRTRTYGINDLGQVAGRVSNWDEANQLTVDRTAFFWDPVSGLQLLPGLGGESGAWGLNNEGQASGWSYLSSDPNAFERAVRWETAVIPMTVIDLGTLANTNGVNGDNSTAYDLNDDGAVTGYSDLPNLAGDFTPFHAILYTNGGGLQDLGTFDTLYPYYQNGYSISYAANAAGQVVGLAHNSDWYFRPFIYDAAGGLRQLPIDSSYSTNEWYAVAINDSSLIGGHVIAATDQSLPCYWTSETADPIALAMPAEFPYGEIYGVNAASVMVGVMWDDTGLEHAFVFDTVNGVRDLNDLIDPATGWVLQFARDINEAGQIVGSGTQDGNERGFLLAPFQPLTVVVDGSGGAEGTVDAVPASGGLSSIQCVYPGVSPGPVTCTGAYPPGTLVQLYATPGPGSVFAGWSGDCSVTGTCLVTMTQARSVTATFTLNTYLLTVNKTGTGTGTVTSNPAGISCGATCSTSFDYNTVVTLSASTGSSSTFTGWSGEGCSGTGTCQVTMSQARAVTATFEFEGSAATFFPITPCRVLDTRSTAGPVLAAGSRRVFTVAGTCGVPSGAKAIVSNLTVVGAGAQGELKVIGGHLTATTTSSISFSPSRARANNAIVQLAADDSGTISVINNSAGTVHFILDVSGYFQ